MFLRLNAVTILKASSRQFTLQIVYLKFPIQMRSSIHEGSTFLKIANKLYLVILRGSFLKTRVISVESFSFSLFQRILKTQQHWPMMSFWFDVAKLKQAKEEEISSTNLSKIEGLPLKYSSLIFLIFIHGNFQNLLFICYSNSAISFFKCIFLSTLYKSNSLMPFHSGGILPLQTFLAQILSVMRQEESIIELATHLKDGSQTSYSVIESYPQLTAGRRYFTFGSEFSKFLFAYLPKQISDKLKCKGV